MSRNTNLIVWLIIVTSLGSIALYASEYPLNNEVSFRVCSPITLTNCPIALSLDSMHEFMVEQRKKLSVWVDDVEVPSQVDDLNGNSFPDEIAFLLSVEKQKPYIVRIKESDSPHYYSSEVWAEMYLK